MNVKFIAAVLTVVAVVYLTVPILNHPIWTSADGVKDANGKYGVLADFSLVDRFDKITVGTTTTKYDKDITTITHGTCKDLKKLTQFSDKDKFHKNCKMAKAAHSGLVVTYILYLAGALFHSHAPKEKRNYSPFYVHMLFLIISWSLLVTLAVSHNPVHADAATSGKTVEMKWNGWTLTVLVLAIVLQAIDLIMTLYSKYSGSDYEPALEGAGMYDYISPAM